MPWAVAAAWIDSVRGRERLVGDDYCLLQLDCSRSANVMQTLDGRRRRAEESGKEDGPERDLGALEAAGQILDLGRV